MRPAARRSVLGLVLVTQAAVALGLAVLPRPARAHEPVRETFMSAFVRVEPGTAHLVIRVPLRVLEAARFPLNGREIDLANVEPAVDRALAILGREITIADSGRPLIPLRAVGRLTLPSDRSFETYEDALGHVGRPVAPGTTIYADQGYLDAHLAYALASPDPRLAIRTTLGREWKDYLKLLVRYAAPGAEGRAMVITSRSGRVSLDPTWYEAATGFVVLGIGHIGGGVDHLLFLLCLIIPVRGPRQTLAIVTAFTLAHSVTLLGSAYDLVPTGAWFPPLVETLIAASILYMALENIVGVDIRRRWLATAAFGLVHGFGFSYGLKEDLQLAGAHRLLALCSFNVGIEIGQLLVLAVMLPALALLLRYVLVGRLGTIVLSALIANVAWDWMVERGDMLWRTEWPQLDGPGLASLARWVAGALVVAGAVGLAAKRLRAARQALWPPFRLSKARGGSREPERGVADARS